MRCIVTAGPTYEPLDDVRRLTNFSTGRLATELGIFLNGNGHEVTLLVGEQATFRAPTGAINLQTFTTTASLGDRLRALSGVTVDAVFHAAAVSDFAFGKIWSRAEAGDLREISLGKISTREGTLLAELIPTPKIIGQMRAWFPKARLIGWKFEVDGNRDAVLRLAQRQITESSTDACVANGPAYGSGFGLVRRDGSCLHLAERQMLFEALEKLLRNERLEGAPA